MGFVLDNSKLLVVSFFFVDLATMRRKILDYFCDADRSGKYSVRERELDLDYVKIGEPNSGGRFPLSAVIYAPRAKEECCVFVSNSSDGWFTLVNRMCKEVSVDCLSLITTQDNVENPINSLRYYRDGNEVRLVRAMKDSDRWDFIEKGEPLRFEDVSIYKKRKVSERLDRESMLKAIEIAGLELRDPDFWKTDIVALYIDEIRSA